jgi:hypothetical protein
MASISEQLAAVAAEIENAKSRGDNTALQSLYSQQLQLGFLAANADTAPVSNVVEVQSDPIVTVDLTDTVKSPENTGVDFTAINTEEKYQNSEIVGPTDSDFGMLGINTDLPTNVALGELGFNPDKITPGAIPPSPRAATVNIKDSKGSIKKDDLRVKIRVPVLDYLGWETTNGPNEELVKLGGIIFPYTPNISYEHKADYASANPTHSNFTQYFYKNSSISPISISGKFTVQNEKDAGVYLATVHLLRALIKMRSGGSQTGDPDSGAPPPVCRLDAYGDFMLKNVPVVISSFKIELPEGIDYFVLGKLNSGIYKQASVPTVSTISITCNPVYSRNEMQKFSVTGWLRDANSRKAGYL